jgi:hypothetical protein
MKMHRYFQDDKISYIGLRFPELHNKPGIVCAPVVNDPTTYIVAIDGDDYIMPERVMSPFQGHLKPADDGKQDGKDKKKSKRGGPTVERRRGKGKEEEDAG